jgi:hypothetical protein
MNSGQSNSKHELAREAWTDAETGLRALALSHPAGHWCGYVGVPPSHPAFRVEYDDVDQAEPESEEDE